MFTILVLVALVTLFYWRIVKPFSYWRERGVPQGRSPWLLGDTWKNAFRFMTPSDMILEIYNKFPNKRYAGVYQFFLPTLMIRDPDLVKRITIKDFDHFVDHRNFLSADVDPLWGKNLLALQGKTWRDMRSILSPTFTSSKLRTMFVLIKDYAENFVDHYSKKNQEVCEIEAKDLFTRITNDIIASTSFGVKVNSLAEPDNKFYLMGKRLTNFTSIKAIFITFGSMFFKNFHKIFKLQLFSKEVRTYFQDLIDENVRVREESETTRPDMINLLVQARKKAQKHGNGVGDELHATNDLDREKCVSDITNEDIAAQAMIFFFGGFDSVSSLMCFTAYELAIHSDIQDRLRQEIIETLEECGGDVTYDAISKMKYMDMVISESLRKWPNFVFMDRFCTKDYVIEPQSPDEKLLRIREGSTLMLPIYGIHHDPEYYPDPEKFDPERFNEENKAKLHSNVFFAFGSGPRNCIGSRFALTETKTIFFHLLSRFEIIPVEKTDIPVILSKKTFNLQPERMKLGLKRIEKQIL